LERRSASFSTFFFSLLEHRDENVTDLAVRLRLLASFLSAMIGLCWRISRERMSGRIAASPLILLVVGDEEELSRIHLFTSFFLSPLWD